MIGLHVSKYIWYNTSASNRAVGSAPGLRWGIIGISFFKPPIGLRLDRPQPLYPGDAAPMCPGEFYWLRSASANNQTHTTVPDTATAASQVRIIGLRVVYHRRQLRQWSLTTHEHISHSACTFAIWRVTTVCSKGAITSKIKHAIKHKTSPARLAQLLQPSLAFCFSLQPMTAYRPVVQQLCKSCRTRFMFYCMFYFTCDRSWGLSTVASESNKYNNSNVRSRCGPGNAYFISLRQVSLPVDIRYYAT